MITLAILIGVIIGIVQIIRTPKPTEHLSPSELAHYYNGGWKDYQRLAELKKEIAQCEEERIKEEIAREVERDFAAIDHLYNQKARLQDMYYMRESQLGEETDIDKQIELHEKLRKLDDQIFEVDQKIQKILDKE
jgi:hypothetical protein